VDRGWLERRLTEGASFEAIGRDLGADPSTVAYWARKHGLASSFAKRHAGRGGLERAPLEALVADGLTVREIAAAVDRSAGRFATGSSVMTCVRTDDVGPRSTVTRAPMSSFASAATMARRLTDSARTVHTAAGGVTPWPSPSGDVA
jgi:hypothetical protein